MSKHLNRGLKGTAVVAIFTILAVGFGYLTRVFLARLITPEEFGLFYSVFTIFMFVAIFTDMGYNQALVKHVPEYLVSNDKKSLNNLIKYVFNINIALTFLVSIIVLSLSKILSQSYLKIESSEIILLFVVILFFNNIFSMVQSLFQSYQDMYNYGLFYFLNKAIFFIGIIILAAIGYNRNAILPTIAYLISLIVVLLIFTKPILKFLSCYSSPSPGDIKKKHQKQGLTYFDKKLFSKITRFAIPSTISNISGTVIGYIDTIVLIFLAPLATVGIYNATISTILIVSYLGGVISIVLFPLISELHTRKDKKSLEAVVNITYRYSLMVVLPLAIAMLFFSRLILKLLFGTAFEIGATAMSVLAIGTIFLTIFQVNSSVINGIGKPKILTYITISAAAFNLAGNIILIPYLGINGAALATTVSYFIMMVWSQIYLYNKVNMKFHKILQTFISALVFFAALYFIKMLIETNILLEIIATCMIAGIFYIVSLFVLKAITIEEIRSLFGKITKK